MRLPVRILTAVFVMLTLSCGTDDGKKRQTRLIPARDLVPILTDLYISDGLLARPEVIRVFETKDSVTSYIEVIERHGYTKAQMDMTMRYYFKHDTKKLQNIYDQVLADLSKIQSELEIESSSVADTSIWNQKTSFALPEDGINNPLSFSIRVTDTGLYVLSFACIIYKDDQSLNPSASAYFWHSDSTDQDVKDLWEKVDLVRDGAKHKYSVSKRLDDTTFTHIKGNLFDSDPQQQTWKDHVKFSNILLKKELSE